MADLQVLEQKANEAVSAGRIERGIDLYLQILKADPRSIRIKKTLGDLYKRVGQTKDAINMYFSLVDAYVKEQKFSQSVPIYRELIRLREKDHELLLSFADALIRTNRQAEAIDAYKKAIDLTQRLKPEIAQDIQKKVIELSPGNFDELVLFAELLGAANWYDQASDEWQRLAGLAGRLAMERDSALYFERALQARDNWEVRLDAVQARLLSDEPRKALAHIQQIPNENRTHHRFLALLAECLQAVDQTAKAGQLWVQAANRFEDPVMCVRAWEQAFECGVSSELHTASYEEAKQNSHQVRLRLHECDWAQPNGAAELRFSIRAHTYLSHNRAIMAVACLEKAEGMQDRLSIWALRMESLIAAGEQDEAIELMQTRLSSGSLSELVSTDVSGRLRGLGVLTEDDLVEDDLLEDDLFDDSELQSEESSESVVESVEESSGPQSLASKLAELRKEANRLVSLGDTNRAIDVYGHILELKPDDNEAAAKIGELMLVGDDSASEQTESIFENTDDEVFDFLSEDSLEFVFDEPSKPQEPLFDSSQPTVSHSSSMKYEFADLNPPLLLARAHLYLCDWAALRPMLGQLESTGPLEKMTILSLNTLCQLRSGDETDLDALDDQIADGLESFESLGDVRALSSGLQYVFCEILLISAEIAVRKRRFRNARRALKELEELSLPYLSDKRALLHALSAK